MTKRWGFFASLELASKFFHYAVGILKLIMMRLTVLSLIVVGKKVSFLVVSVSILAVNEDWVSIAVNEDCVHSFSLELKEEGQAFFQKALPRDYIFRTFFANRHCLGDHYLLTISLP